MKRSKPNQLRPLQHNGEYFAKRAARGNVRKALRILRRAGKENAPLAGDKLPKKSGRFRRESPRQRAAARGMFSVK